MKFSILLENNVISVKAANVLQFVSKLQNSNKLSTTDSLSLLPHVNQILKKLVH
jgi:hypothetical protein